VSFIAELVLESDNTYDQNAGGNSASAFATLSKVPLYNALLRTTCVATMMQAGHAENALPATARATVNCRILPGEDAAAVERSFASLATHR